MQDERTQSQATSTDANVHRFPIPFIMRNMDILELFPDVTTQRKFLIVAIDQFTSRIEAKPLTKITTKQASQFLWENMISWYVILQLMVMDSGR